MVSSLAYALYDYSALFHTTISCELSQHGTLPALGLYDWDDVVVRDVWMVVGDFM